jgi:peptidoglycan hydrolase-like protein with peptidoglycan-binding domain
MLEARQEQSVDGRDARGWLQRRRWMVAAGAAGVVGLGVIVAVLAGAFDSGGGTSGTSQPTLTATVARRDLVQRSTVPGVLGYADSRPLMNAREGTITWLPGEGSLVRPGGVLYRVDERPIALFSGNEPAWRPLALGATDGLDVRQLEQNLRALGYDRYHQLTIDSHFDAATAAALVRWQESVGLAPTGRLDVGDVVFLPGTRRVGVLRAALGTRVRPGMPIMTTSATTRSVTAQVETSKQQDVAVGDKVVVDLRNGSTTTGTIVSVGRVASVAAGDSGGDDQMAGASSAAPTIPFEIRLDKPELAGSLDQAPVDVAITSERARNALSVPVSALLALTGGRYGVQAVRGSATVIVPVTPGLYSDGGYVEIEQGDLKPGDRVVVPA